MGLLDEIKNQMKTVSDKIPEIKDETVDKIKKAGEDSIELTKELIGDISDKVSDITALSRLKFEINNLKKDLDMMYMDLGEIVYKQSKKKAAKTELSSMENALKKVNENFKLLNKKTQEYDQLKKERSDSYVVQKMSEELSEAGAIIDQTIVSEKSTIAGKILKEITLPREALITVVKRGDEVIIPNGNTQIEIGDLVTVSGIEADVIKVIKRLSAQ